MSMSRGGQGYWILFGTSTICTSPQAAIIGTTYVQYLSMPFGFVPKKEGRGPPACSPSTDPDSPGRPQILLHTPMLHPHYLGYTRVFDSACA
jgi:hypothetical protein